jgi:hypothetical protein
MWIAPPKEAKYVLYYGGEASGKDKSFRAIYSDKLTSKIGFTWREIRRPHDLEIGVKGGELMVVDLQSGEVLGIRRGFIAALERKFGSWQGWSGAICPSYGDKPGYGGRNKDSTSTYWFITKVAKPKISASFKPDGESK